MLLDAALFLNKDKEVKGAKINCTTPYIVILCNLNVQKLQEEQKL